ncbi:hypothetical protein [Priestia endophytica]|uniref:hypothetical protein n=1 Tax=Priestia endophytica TaxID=135735 RepID=UPI002280BD01|nr:hypothetical protein [Priestia endophytica]MCY8233789.1 hypothetical protein [Priestia endophytica]
MSRLKRFDGYVQNRDVQKWVDTQADISKSINNLVSHMIKIFGYRDIMDYDVQEALFRKAFNSSHIEKGNGNPDSDHDLDHASRRELNTLIIGKAESGKTTILRKLIHEGKDDFKIIISNRDECKIELESLESEGYTIAIEGTHLQDPDIPFSEKVRIASNISIEKNKILYIGTNILKDGFDPQLFREFFDQVIMKNEDTKKVEKVRVYLDDLDILLHSAIPINMIADKDKYNCIVYGTLQSVKDLNPDLLTGYKIIKSEKNG